MLFVFILLFYIVLCLKYRRNKVLLVLLLLQVISVSCAILINLNSYSDVTNSYYNVPYILLITTLLILPWKKYGEIVAIYRVNEGRLKMLSNVLFIIASFSFVVLSVVAIVVQLYLGDTVINEFKDETTDFYYHMLPFDVHWYLLARVLYPFSYFLIPLHFYYLYIGNNKKGYMSAILSLNIVIYGLAFFSRWTLMLFVCLYMVFWFMFKDILPKKSMAREKKIIIYILAVLFIIFTAITLGRFSSDDGVSARYAEKIPSESPIQNPSLYSVMDYLGQSNSNGLFLLNNYKGQHFGFAYPLMGIQDLLSGIGLVEPSNAFDLQEKHWGEYSDKFTGYTAYSVYDFGYLLSFLIAMGYFLVVFKRKKSLYLYDLLTAVILIQIPVCSIYYSQASDVVLELIFYIPIWLYLRFSYKPKMVNYK